MKIILYSTHCPKCTALEAKLKAANIVYEENNDKEYMLAQGWKEVPILQVEDNYYNFGEAVKWIQLQKN